MAKLYDDEENAFEDEMKVFDMGAESDQEEPSQKKRSIKAEEKGKVSKATGKSAIVSATKINRLVRKHHA